MLRIEQHQSVEGLRATPEQLDRLAAWISQEIEDAISAKAPLDAVHREMLRMYEGVPKNPARNIPIENAPNIEVTIGAVACDALYAQVIDGLFAGSQFITTQSTNADSQNVERSKAVQRFSNWMTTNELKLRGEAEHSILDDVQLGTGVVYIPWVNELKKTKVAKITYAGPRAIAVPIEDFFLPGGAKGDLQQAQWCAIRLWPTPAELAWKAKALKWNLDGVQPIGVVGWVRSRREQLGRTMTKVVSELYEQFDVYCLYDIDGDGFAEDLLVNFDRFSRKIMKVQYCPFDHKPIEAMRYQLRAHLFYGMGVLEMLRPYQDEATEIHNARTLNVLLANARIWKSKPGSVDKVTRLWPNKVVEVTDPDDVMPEAMADVYPSISQAEQITIQLAERRVGVNEMNTPRPSQIMGSRTPGITALSLLNQVNRRFAPAFDAARLCMAACVRQGLYRYQERLLAGDVAVEDHIKAVMGPAEGQLIIDALKDPNFDEAVKIELTAASANVNKEVERQNALMLVQILSGYYERILTLVQIASNPMTPPPIVETAKKIADAAGELVERTIRTFDQVRDPQRFIITMEETLDGLDVPQAGLGGLASIIAQLAAVEGGGGAQGGTGQNPGRVAPSAGGVQRPAQSRSRANG